jgi:predicted negative regulator of RcsB-dependent stress response
MAGPYDLEEQENLTAIRNWWEDNALYLYIAIAVAVLGIAGYKGWQYWSREQAEDAAALYGVIEKSDKAKKIEAIDGLVAKHPRSFYTSEAQLVAARELFDAGKLPEAAQRLDWVLKNGREEHRGVARVRLAAVLLDQKKPAEALELLDANKDESYAALVADLKGDVLFSQGRIDEARASYKLVVEKSEARSPLRSIAEVKLSALGGSQ